MQCSTTEFETLYIRIFPPSMRLAMSLLHDEDEARDAVQEVFVRLWETDSRISNPDAFIVRSVRNACLNRISKLDARERIRQKLTLDSTPPEDFDIESRNEEVQAAISRLLTSREKQVVEKIYAEGLSYKEAAANLGVSVGAINKNIVGALKKLRTHFKNR